jgi:hypothetical protein
MAEYSFLTSKSWRIDATGKNARDAYKDALKQYNKIFILDNEVCLSRFGKLLRIYLRYNKDGIASLDSWKKLK